MARKSKTSCIRRRDGKSKCKKCSLKLMREKADPETEIPRGIKTTKIAVIEIESVTEIVIVIMIEIEPEEVQIENPEIATGKEIEKRRKTRERGLVAEAEAEKTGRNTEGRLHHLRKRDMARNSNSSNNRIRQLGNLIR
jgi:hypothetical protein